MIDIDPYIAAFCAVVWLIANFLVGFWIGTENGRTLASIVLSILGGPVGWIAALLLTPCADVVIGREIALEQARLKVRESRGPAPRPVQEVTHLSPTGAPVRSIPTAARTQASSGAPTNTASKDGPQKSFEEWIQTEERRWEGE